MYTEENMFLRTYTKRNLADSLLMGYSEGKGGGGGGGENATWEEKPSNGLQKISKITFCL